MMDGDTDHIHAHEGHGATDHDGCDHRAATTAMSSPQAATDPVCGMNVDPAASRHRLDHGGRTFHFCSARCQEKFVAAPAS
jgi:Cu+-exporting ATPase